MRDEVRMRDWDTIARSKHQTELPERFRVNDFLEVLGSHYSVPPAWTRFISFAKSRSTALLVSSERYSANVTLRDAATIFALVAIVRSSLTVTSSLSVLGRPLPFAMMSCSTIVATVFVTSNRLPNLSQKFHD